MTKGKVRRDQRDFQVSIGSSFWKTLPPLEGTKEPFGVIAKAETLRVDFASTVAWGAYFRGDCSCSLMSEGKGDAGSFRLPVGFSLYHQG